MRRAGEMRLDWLLHLDIDEVIAQAPRNTFRLHMGSVHYSENSGSVSRPCLFFLFSLDGSRTPTVILLIGQQDADVLPKSCSLRIFVFSCSAPSTSRMAGFCTLQFCMLYVESRRTPSSPHEFQEVAPFSDRLCLPVSLSPCLSLCPSVPLSRGCTTAFLRVRAVYSAALRPPQQAGRRADDVRQPRGRASARGRERLLPGSEHLQGEPPVAAANARGGGEKSLLAPANQARAVHAGVRQR